MNNYEKEKRTMKTWLVTRIAHSTIEVESETNPLQGKDKWEFESKHLKQLDDNYNDDGITCWEIQEKDWEENE